MAIRMSRRGFLAGVLLASGLGREGTAMASPKRSGSGLEPLRRLFDDPPLEARPMTRWWWFGGAVTPAEITRELTFMRDAGLGAAEIQPVYPVVVDDPARGIRHLRYFSDEWYDVLRHAAREARRLGLALDLTLGSGWPYGGPFMPMDLAARRLRPISQDVVGPQAVSWDLAPHLTGDDRLVAIMAAPVVASQQVDLARSQVITSPQGGPPREGPGLRDWPLPAGEWRLFAFIDSPTGQQVKRPTLGMEGPVLDHFSREALQRFLSSAGDRVLDALGPAPLRSVFCDSLEVYGADWTRDLLVEFRARRGYDLTPQLPALWQETGADTPHVRYDYHLTLSELLLENFFKPLVAWSEGRGVTARIQAHGAMGDVMQAYGLAHVPEGESIFGGDRYAVNLRHRRLASSAAHLYGKRLVSGEAYTWLRTPLYMTSLEMMKAATDCMFLDGINHVVNHGYSYSPPEAGEPGWAFYASTEVNHTNTWWRHYHHLARYVRRTQALLQHGVSVNRVAVYLPLADVYATHGAGGLHADVELERRLGDGLLAALRLGGYDFDLIHDHAFAALARSEAGRLRFGTAEYDVVIVPAVRFMPAESAARLLEVAERGGRVIFVGRLPEAAPGLTGQPERSAALSRSLDRLRVHALVVADDAEAVARLASMLHPDFQIIEAVDGDAGAREAAAQDIRFVHRRAVGVDYYFVANVSARAHDVRARFAVGHRAPERWDPETGSHPGLAYDYISSAAVKQTEVELRLAPFESCLVAFGSSSERPLVTRTTLPGLLEITKRDAGGELRGQVAAEGTYALTLGSGLVRRIAVEGIPSPLALAGPWRLALGPSTPVVLDRLVSWTELPEGESFSGWATYETDFEFADLGEELEWQLDLGAVHETAEVTLNGQELGAAWKAPRRLSCGAALVAGRNRLKIEVANLWIHHIVEKPPPPEWRAVEETFGIRWGRYGEVKPESLPPAGLLGPVRLVASRRVRVTLGA